MDRTSFPAGLELGGRRVVLVGAARPAGERLAELVAARADVLLVAQVLPPSMREPVRAGVAAGRIEWRRRRFSGADLDGAWLVLTCTEDETLGAEAAAEAAARRLFCLTATPARADAGSPATGLARADVGPPLTGVALVGGGPGAPDLITVRGRRLLRRADVVITDRLAPRELLAELDPGVTVVDAAKVPYGRSMPQEDIHQVMIAHARAGRFVVRLKGGDPFVFGRGYEEVIACAEAGIPVTVVPGVTSAFAVPAGAGTPVSHRGVAHEIVVVSGHFGPDDPRSLVDWAALGRMRGTVVLMMAVQRAEQFARALVTHGRPPDTPVVVVQNGTTPDQRSLTATLATMAARMREQHVQPPAVIVVGPVAGLDPSTVSWMNAGAGRYGVPQPA